MKRGHEIERYREGRKLMGRGGRRGRDGKRGRMGREGEGRWGGRKEDLREEGKGALGVGKLCSGGVEGEVVGVVMHPSRLEQR